MTPLENLNKYEIILGSKSPRRQELLKGLEINFTTKVIDGVEETYPDYLDVEDIPLYLSKLKAQAYSNSITDNQLVITADTIVISINEMMGKPKDAEQARSMLRKLSGKVHTVITGVTIYTKEKHSSFKVSTDVEFAKLSDDEIEYYIDKYKPFDKAGAYGIQEWIGSIGVRSINGSFYNVMGLPVQRLYEELKNY